MSTSSYVAGILFLIMSTIGRSMAYRDANIHKIGLIELLSIPSKDHPDIVYTFIGQLMGVVWILLGIFLTITRDWFSSSMVGVILEPFIVFIPFLIGGIMLKIGIARKKE